MNYKRRSELKQINHWRVHLVRWAAAFFVTLAASPAHTAEKLVVYKSPTCGCCSEWVQHMKKGGFDVEVREVADILPYEQKFGVPQALSSCHIATVSGYVIEGHVPASDVKRLLRERPKAKGLSVPGMPQGAPGMEQGRPQDRYETLLFDAAGKSTVFERH